MSAPRWCGKGLHDMNAPGGVFATPRGVDRCAVCYGEWLEKRRAEKRQKALEAAEARRARPPRPCSIEGCERKHYAKGWCKYHYQRWYQFGDPSDPPPRPACEVADCDRLVHGRQPYCQKHYIRNWKYGDPYIVARRQGSDSPQWIPDSEVTYWVIHQRLKRELGNASTFRCVDCDGPAKDWSYNYGDPMPRWDERGGWYSVDMANYEPRCRRCHRNYDVAARNLKEANA